MSPSLQTAWRAISSHVCFNLHRHAMSKDFHEIAHAGGKITFHIGTDANGDQTYQIGFAFSGPVRMSLVAVYALPQGVAVATLDLRGIGDSWDPPPIPGCFPVLIASDSEGHFGHHCPHCRRYWRSGPWPNICPYCRASAEPHQFLSLAQRRYVHHYCEVLSGALATTSGGDVEIDMDAVADASRTGKKPPLDVSEESQQRKFRCSACNEFNDILGRFGYCSQCATRNDLAEFQDRIVPRIRQRLAGDAPPEDCVRDAVAAFESFIRQITQELTKLVPMSPARERRLSTRRFHNLSEVHKILSVWFDINVRANIAQREWDSTVLMFHRRHVYEHNAGEVDQKYLDDSGDATVRLKQHIHETQQDVHDFLGPLVKMAGNLHVGFHAIFPPLPDPAAVSRERRSGTSSARRGTT